MRSVTEASPTSTSNTAGLGFTASLTPTRIPFGCWARLPPVGDPSMSLSAESTPPTMLDSSVKCLTCYSAVAWHCRERHGSGRALSNDEPRYQLSGCMDPLAGTPRAGSSTARSARSTSVALARRLGGRSAGVLDASSRISRNASACEVLALHRRWLSVKSSSRRLSCGQDIDGPREPPMRECSGGLGAVHRDLTGPREGSLRPGKASASSAQDSDGQLNGRGTS